MEYVNQNQPEATSIPPEDAEELSFCNCENTACETPYQREDVVSSIKNQADTTPESNKIKRICRTTVRRLKAAWEQSEGLPYLKHTKTCSFEFCNSDGTPVDRFDAEKVKKYALRTLLVAAAATVVLLFCIDGITKSCKKKE